MGKYDWVMSALSGLGFREKMSLVKKFLSDRKKVPDVVKCALCPNMCRFNCPIATVSGDESLSPAGKSRIAMAIENDWIEPVEENILPLYYCGFCGACKPYCAFDISVGELLIPIREKLLTDGKAPKKVYDIVNRIKGKRTFLEEKPKGEPRNGNALIILGDWLRAFYKDLESSYVELIKRLGYEPATFEVEPYCGILLYYLGATSDAREIYSELANKINAFKGNVVIVADPSCAYLLRKILPKLGIKVKKKVYHIAEFILENKDKLKFAEKSDEIVIHEPCKLTIGLERQGILKEILKLVPGISLREPFRSGKNTFCIEGFYLIKELDEEMYRSLIHERARELKEEAEITVTSCPICMKELEEAGVKVMDLVDFLVKAIA